MSMSKKDFIKYEHEIRWIENELATKKLSPAQRGEYRHQIRKKELEIAFNSGHREAHIRRKPMITWLKAEDQHQHKNGGGWVANTATVKDSVYI